jgi:hypothetical protein
MEAEVLFVRDGCVTLLGRCSCGLRGKSSVRFLHLFLQWQCLFLRG